MKDVVNILHLSDLHFGVEGTDKVTSTALVKRELVLKGLVEHLNGIEKEWKPDVVVVSGDIGWKGMEGDYKQAGAWIRELLDALGLTDDRLVMCAGNHDINRDKAEFILVPDNAEQADKFLALEKVSNIAAPFEAYELFCKNFSLPPYNIGEQESYLIGQREIEGLNFVVLNSAWFCRGDKDRNRLWLGLPQIQVMVSKNQVASKVNYDTSAITVSVLHHPCEFFNEKDKDEYGDTRPNTYQYLAQHSHIILSGHTHGSAKEPGREGGYAYVYTGGASYVNSEYKNCFSILQVDRIRRTVKQRNFVYSPGYDEWGRNVFIKDDAYSLRIGTVIEEEDERVGNNFGFIEDLIEFREDMKAELLGEIEKIQSDSVLVDKIVTWYEQDRISFKDFCGRRDKLRELMDKMERSVEVHGVGGVGKTTFIHIALLLQKLKGKRIVTIGTSQSYASDSGYMHFVNKLMDKDVQWQVVGAKVTLDDIIKMLEIPDEIRKLSRAEVNKSIADTIKNQNIMLFIDDFHLAGEDVEELVKSINSNLVISSKSRTDSVRSRVMLEGVAFEERDILIDTIQRRLGIGISEEARDKIKRIAEGHPISTEMLVRNWDTINFDKFEDFKQEDFSDSKWVQDFLRRVVQDIFKECKSALEFLKDIAVINTDLDSNIDDEALKKAYSKDVSKWVPQLIKSGLLAKKKEGVYGFAYRHIIEVLDDDQKARHEKALKYYQGKKDRNRKEDLNDGVEKLYHQIKSKQFHLGMVDAFIKLSESLSPVHYGFERLVGIGDLLKEKTEGSDRADVLGNLGYLYGRLKRYEKAENACDEALEIYKKLAEKNEAVYLPDVAGTQNNIGILYKDLKKYEEAEKAYKEALKIYKKLTEKNEAVYLPDVAMTQNNIGSLYSHLIKYEEAEKAYKEALEIRKKLAEKNEAVYLPYVAGTQNNIGSLYKHLKKYEEAEKAYKEALEIYKKLAEKNEAVYLPYVAGTQNNIGILYKDLKKYEEAERAYKEALEIRKKLAEKNEAVYLPDVAMTQNNIGSLYSDLKKYEEAEQAYKEALEIRKKLAEKNEALYLSDVSDTKNSLGYLYIKLGKTNEAEKLLNEHMTYYTHQESVKKGDYRFDITIASNNLGELYHHTHNLPKAERLYTDSLTIFQELNQQYPKTYTENIAWVKLNLAKLTIDQNDPQTGIPQLQTILHQGDLPLDLIPEAHEYLAKAHEALGDTVNAATSYLTAAQTHYTLYQKGVHCLPEIHHNLQNAIRLGTPETQHTAQTLLTTLK